MTMLTTNVASYILQAMILYPFLHTLYVHTYVVCVYVAGLTDLEETSSSMTESQYTKQISVHHNQVSITNSLVLLVVLLRAGVSARNTKMEGMES